MRILYDEDIPLLAEYCTKYSIEAYPFSHRNLTKKLLDYYSPQGLCIRSTTKINVELIRNSSIEFIATATSGMDHIDRSILQSDSIHCASAIGSNANAVAEYCISGILEYAKVYEKNVQNLTLGIVGYGNVGQRLALYASLLGMDILVHDIPRLNKDLPFFHEHHEFHTILDRADCVSFHVPLDTSSVHSTYHYLNKSNVSLLRSSQLVINAARGSIIDESSLLHKEDLPALVLDTWEHEPNISISLAKKCFIATPHSAGYTKQAKHNATVAIFNALLSHFGIASDVPIIHFDITYRNFPLQASEKTRLLLASPETARVELSGTRKIRERSLIFLSNSQHFSTTEASYFDNQRNICLNDDEHLQLDL
ncbi:MAG: NAD(P)-dependent oxidoreductase [Candidatus Kapaibacterium sp.]|jgi:erythronate-4-phosphate dehydrogenase